MIGTQLSLMFEEDKGLLGTPDDILRCKGSRFVFDVETTGLDWWVDKLLGVGIYCPERGVKRFITSDHEVAAKLALAEVAMDSGTTVIAHNCKFDSHFMDLRLWECSWELQDTGVMAHLLDSRVPKALRALEQLYLGTGTKIQKMGKLKGASIKAMPLGTMAAYCLNDCRVTMEIADKLLPKLEELKLMRLFKHEMRYAAFLQRMERHGVLLDRRLVEASCQKFEDTIRALEPVFFEKTNKGRPFNWRSAEQLSWHIYEGLGIKRPDNPFIAEDGVDSRAAGSKAYTESLTGVFILNKIGHPLAELISELRETDKLKDMLEEWLEVSASDGALHSSLNQTRTRTGRLSSSRPNLQNAPSTKRAKTAGAMKNLERAYRVGEYNLREAWVARSGYVLLSADHKQQEMRLFAILAKEPSMLQAMREKRDIHLWVAKTIWGVEDDLHRSWAKEVGFGLIYGMSSKGLAWRLDVSPQKAQEIIGQYFGAFPRIQQFIRETEVSCRQRGYVRYWSGRLWRETDERFFYKGVNAKVQGGAGDLISVAAMRLQRFLDEHAAGQVELIVHDEVVSEVPIDKVAVIASGVVTTMAVEDVFKIPFDCELKVGLNYGKMVSLNKWLDERAN